MNRSSVTRRATLAAVSCLLAACAGMAGAVADDTVRAIARPVAAVAPAAATRPALSVPAAALVRRGGLDGVFVLDASGVARFRLVKTGERLVGRVEILAGLFGGETLVLGDLSPLYDGMRVHPQDGSAQP